MGLVAGLEPGDPRDIGPYRILGKLGSGGMGHVFLGLSAGGRPIAVKVIREELADDPQFRSRFRREVAAARKVSGLFTALVVDADLDDPVPWLATAYVAGPSLTDAVREHGPLPVQPLLALAAGLAEGLNAIHTAGVVHRDLKPSNVLLAEDGPRVIDFGISEAAEASALTGANVVIGSPGFMSPEQVLSQEIGPPSDMFSLGAVLTFAGTGEGPFGSGPNVALVYRLVNSPASLGLLPEEIRSLVGNCLAKHPGDRPTALELLAEVGAIQPERGWLSESIIYGSTDSQPVDDLVSAAVAATVVPFAAAPAPAARPEEGSHAARPAKRRLSRPLASAGITGGLLAASAGIVFALTGGVPRTALAPQAEPQAAASSSSASTSHSSATPSAAASGRAAAPAANAYLTPSLSEFLTSSPPATTLPTPTRSASPGRSPSPSDSPVAAASPSASASASSSASPSPSASSSPTQSTSPSPTPTPTESTSPTPTESTSPTPTPTPTESTAAPTDGASPPASASPSTSSS